MTGRSAGGWGNPIEDDERGFFTKERQIVRRLNTIEKFLGIEKQKPTIEVVGANDTAKLESLLSQLAAAGLITRA